MLQGCVFATTPRPAAPSLPHEARGVIKLPMAQPKEVKLEDALKRLAEIVKSLEQNESPLDDSLKLFEEGISLTRACNAKLTEAERRIELLSRVSPEGVETKPLETS